MGVGKTIKRVLSEKVRYRLTQGDAELIYQRCVSFQNASRPHGGVAGLCKCNQHRVSYTSNPDHLGKHAAGRVLTSTVPFLSNQATTRKTRFSIFRTTLPTKYGNTCHAAQTERLAARIDIQIGCAVLQNRFVQFLFRISL